MPRCKKRSLYLEACIEVAVTQSTFPPMRKLNAGRLIAWLFIFLFVYAATSKLLHYQEFTVQIGKSPLLTHFTGFFTWFVPALEIGISLLLASPRWQLTGLYASFGLMVFFTAYIIAILRFSDYIPCSFGGILQDMNWNQHLIFNCVFVALGVMGVLLYKPASNYSPINHLV